MLTRWGLAAFERFRCAIKPNSCIAEGGGSGGAFSGGGGGSSRSIFSRNASKCDATSGTSNVDKVINETVSSNKRNFISQFKLSADEALDAGLRFLGKGYREIGKTNSGVFRSQDSTRQFRIDSSSISGSHKPNVPHIHLEILKSGSKKPSVNNHVPFLE